MGQNSDGVKCRISEEKIVFQNRNVECLSEYHIVSTECRNFLQPLYRHHICGCPYSPGCNSPTFSPNRHSLLNQDIPESFRGGTLRINRNFCSLRKCWCDHQRKSHYCRINNHSGNFCEGMTKLNAPEKSSETPSLKQPLLRRKRPTLFHTTQ